MNPTALAIIAYAWWGFVPVYWKLLQSFPSKELILYRILLSTVFLLPFFFLKSIGPKIPWTRKNILGLFASGLLIGFNWFLYVWSVNHGHVVDASLGYFLNPLINVALGTLVFRDKMKNLQKIACALAALGVGLLVLHTGNFPWIAFLLASSFAMYGLVRKILHVPTIRGTFVETMLLTPVALLGLYWLWQHGYSHFPQATSKELWLLSLAGIVTTVPLLAFAESAKYLTLSTMGFFQFISPSLQFLLGVFVYHESFGGIQWAAFSFIWMGLLLFLVDLRSPKRLFSLL